MHALKAINELDAIIKDVTIPDIVLEFFYHDYIKNGAKYKDGLNAVVGDDKRYTVNRALKEWSTTVTPKRDILEGLHSNVTPEKIAGFFGDLFDFDYNKHKSDDLEVLYEVTARHLVIMFHAFDELQKYDDTSRNKIVDSFLQKEVLEKSRWSEHLVEPDMNSLKKGVGKYGELQNGSFRMKVHDTGISRDGPQLYNQTYGRDR